MIPAKLAPFVFGFLVSGMMSCLASFVATVKALGFVDNLLGLWLPAWFLAWAVAFPTILVVAPFVRRFVDRNTRKAP